MKLHLTKSLRAALLACVCAAVSSTALADVTVSGTTLTVGEGGGTYTATSTTDESTGETITSVSVTSTDLSKMLSSGSDAILTTDEDTTLSISLSNLVDYWSSNALVSNLTLSGNVDANVSNGGLLLDGSTLTVEDGADLRIAGVWSKSGSNSMLSIGEGSTVTLYQYGTDGSSYSPTGTGYGNLEVALDGGTLSFTSWSNQNIVGSNTTFTGEGTLQVASTSTTTDSETGETVTTTTQGTVTGALKGTGILTLDAKLGSGASVNGGLTLVIGDTGSIVSNSSITVQGTSETEEATLQIDSDQILGGGEGRQGTIYLKGNANLTGSGSLAFQNGYVIASGTNNEISVDLKQAWNVNLQVEKDGELTFSGDYVSVASGAKLVKSGAGTLTLTSTASVGDEVDLIVNGGTLKFAESVRTINADIEVNEDGELFVDETIVNNVTLNGGVLTVAANHSGKGSVTVTSEGGTIQGASASAASAAVFAVGGEGDLTLDGALNVENTINNSGSVTVDGSVTLQTRWDKSTTGSIGADVTDVNVNGTFTVSDGTVANSGDVNVSGKLTLNGGTVSSDINVGGTGAVVQINSYATVTSDIVVSDGGTLEVGTSPTMSAAGITVELGGTLDLKKTEALTLQSLDLNAGTTIVLGENTRITISDALTIGEGVIFDVSSWCTYDSFTPYELFTFTGDSSNLLLPQNVTIKTSTANNEVAFLTYDSVSGKVTLVPEPTTATLSLLALAGLAMRRRRK